MGLLRIHVFRGVNLAVRDVVSSDPYVIFKMGKQVPFFFLLFFFLFSFCFSLTFWLKSYHLILDFVLCWICLDIVSDGVLDYRSKRWRRRHNLYKDIWILLFTDFQMNPFNIRSNFAKIALLFLESLRSRVMGLSLSDSL